MSILSILLRLYLIYIFDTPGVAGAVLQTAPLLIHYLSQSSSSKKNSITPSLSNRKNTDILIECSYIIDIMFRGGAKGFTFGC